MFKKLSLRTKLLIALGVPLAALLIFVSLRVNSSLDRAELADRQLEEVDRTLQIKSVADAMRLEQAAFTGFSTTPEQHEVVRQQLDDTLNNFLSNPGRTTNVDLDQLREVQESISNIREEIPLDPAAFRRAIARELTQGALGEGPTAAASIEFVALTGRVDGLTTSEPTRLLDPETAHDLGTVSSAIHLSEALRAENAAISQSLALPDNAINLSLLTYIQGTVSVSESAEQQLLATSSERWKEALRDVYSTRSFTNLADQRTTLTIESAIGEELPLDPTTYGSANLGSAGKIRAFSTEVVDTVRTESESAHSDAQRDALMNIGFAAALMVFLSVLSIALYRSIRNPIQDLTKRSRLIAEVELPAVVEQMRTLGSEGEMPEIPPLVSSTNDEIGDLVQAFNEMASTSVTLAGEQAASRRVVADMFINLGRRNQKLLLRMLDQLEGLESNEEDADRLEQLFAVDHLATRMRRNAESLLVLAGAKSARQFSEPIDVGDVLRSALTEVEDYQRVDLKIMNDATITGSLVTDLSHLLAELVENALAFSPKGIPVELVAVDTRNGFTIAVTDQGLGLSPDELVNANNRIQAAAQEEETPSKFLGLHVVGRLAARHSLSVELIEGLPTGVTARIRLPLSAVGSISAGVEEDDGSETALVELLSANTATDDGSEPGDLEFDSDDSDISEPTFDEDDEELDEEAASYGDSISSKDSDSSEPIEDEQTSSNDSVSSDSSQDDEPGASNGLAKRVPGNSSLATKAKEANASSAAKKNAAAKRKAKNKPKTKTKTPVNSDTDSSGDSNVFGTARRTPGENMPSGLKSRKKPAEAENLQEALPKAPDDARSVGSNLGNFQSATKRADGERLTTVGADSADDQDQEDDGGNK